jgi:hypothetical protein
MTEEKVRGKSEKKVVKKFHEGVSAESPTKPGESNPFVTDNENASPNTSDDTD